MTTNCIGYEYLKIISIYQLHWIIHFYWIFQSLANDRCCIRCNLSEIFKRSIKQQQIVQLSLIHWSKWSQWSQVISGVIVFISWPTSPQHWSDNQELHVHTHQICSKYTTQLVQNYLNQPKKNICGCHRKLFPLQSISSIKICWMLWFYNSFSIFRKLGWLSLNWQQLIDVLSNKIYFCPATYYCKSEDCARRQDAICGFIYN